MLFCRSLLPSLTIPLVTTVSLGMNSLKADESQPLSSDMDGTFQESSYLPEYQMENDEIVPESSLPVPDDIDPDEIEEVEQEEED